MAVRLAALLPRAVVVVLVWMLATAAFTLAADRQIIGPSASTATKPAPAPPLEVPSVTGQAFVFAKGMLEDAGFAWRVVGSVHGYAGNTVASQSPAAGTKVINTGAPTVVLHLARGPYEQQGAPEDTASYVGTRIVLAGPSGTAIHQAPVAKPKVEAGASNREAEEEANSHQDQARRQEAGQEDRACGQAARVHRPGRAEGAARRDQPPRPREPARGVGRHEPEAQQEERPALALPARLDRRRGQVRLVARSRRRSRP